MKYLLPLLLLLTGCASPYYTSTNEGGSGSIEIEFAHPGHATVMINDVKVDTPKRKVRSVTIESLDPGEHEVYVLVGRGGKKTIHEETRLVTVHPDQKSTVVIRNPNLDAGYWITTYALVGAGAYLGIKLAGQ